jgi:hypothetical protein
MALTAAAQRTQPVVNDHLKLVLMLIE